MIPTLLSVPIISSLVILQTAVLSRTPLLQGTADIVMLVIIAWALQEQVETAWQWSAMAGLMVGLVSALHFLIPLVSYLAVTGLALATKRRIWQIPILGMSVVTVVGTLFHHQISFVAVSIAGTDLPWFEAMQVITLPSLLLNILLAVPVFVIVRDFAEWLHPQEIVI